MSGTPLCIEQIPIGELSEAERNPRVHSRQQLRKIARSIKRHGFTNPILIGDDNRIIAGHARFAAAKQLELSEVPCIRLSSLTGNERRAYVIADNKLAQDAQWDFEALALEFGDLIEAGFEVDLTGFEQPQIDAILADAAEASSKPLPEDEYDGPSPGNAVTRIGDLWLLGRHKVVCGDAKDPQALDTLMDGETADMSVLDPPYNVRIGGNVVGRGRHREFVEASGEMTPVQFTEFLTNSLQNAARVCRAGAVVYVFMDWRHLEEAHAAGDAVFSQLLNLCVWAKTNAGMGTFYRSQHELIFVWKVGDAPHTNTFGLGDKGRYRTNVWTYAGVNTFRSGRAEELAMHPTVKPVALVADAIRDVSHRGQLVLDVFGGSGTTLIAAEKSGRVARLMELDPTYCDVIIRRWQRLTGKRAALVSTGEDFETVESERLAGDHTNEELVA